MRIQYAGAVYRRAGVRDVARVLATTIFPWIYKLGLSKERVVEWLNSLTCPLPGGREAQHAYIPDDLKLQICRVLSTTGMVVGDVVRELVREIEDNPPPGFRWKKDPDTGDMTLVKHSYKGKEKALHRGIKFEDKVFVGCWWVTENASGSANRRLQSLLRKHDGGVFLKLKVPGATEYYGYAIVESDAADALGLQLDNLCKEVVEEGTGEYRLSAMRLDGLAERRQLHPGDLYTLTGIYKSIKYNHEINLNDLLLGRVPDLKSVVQNLLRKYQG